MLKVDKRSAIRKVQKAFSINEKIINITLQPSNIVIYNGNQMLAGNDDVGAQTF